jgi:uncharacterized protein (DUF885 family)
MKPIQWLCSILLLLGGATSLPAAVAANPSSTATAAQQLHALFDREWEVHLKEDPLFATAVGRHEYDDRLPSTTFADLERRSDLWRGMLTELAGIDRAALTGEDPVSYDIFQRELLDRVADFSLGGYQMPFTTVRDYENYIRRLQAWPRFVGEQIELIRRGLQRGMVLPRVVLAGYDKTISSHVVESAEKSVFFRPFTRFPATFPEAEKTRLLAAGRGAVIDGAVAGYRQFLDFYNREYLPKTRTTLGAIDLPNGKDYYQQQIRQYTTLDLTPEQIHQIGLSEVARIEKEMQGILQQVGFQGDLAAFIQFLRTDPRFYPKSADELLKEAAWIAKRMDGKLPALFGRLPRLPYTVEPVPETLAPKYTSGRYAPPPAGGTQPGRYWVNIYKFETRPLYNLEALTLHESVPGHHLQGSLARELEDLPMFRRFLYHSAFGEGWGLYSEWLGLEAGFYTDPYRNFGRLTYEAWRACRLVVDTGVHVMGWTRQQMVDYLAAHTALPLQEVETETDRYISWPGQALAYKLGEIKIKELRRKAEKELGEKFDVREFHDTVLGHGSVPLDVLEKQVNAYISERKARS